MKPEHTLKDYDRLLARLVAFNNATALTAAFLTQAALTDAGAETHVDPGTAAPAMGMEVVDGATSAGDRPLPGSQRGAGSGGAKPGVRRVVASKKMAKEIEDRRSTSPLGPDAMRFVSAAFKSR